MKIISLFFLAIGLVAGDLLDRSYLPPPGAKLAGGSPGAIDTPFDLPKGSPQYPEDTEDTERSGGLGRPTNIPPEFIDLDGVTAGPSDSNYYQNGFPTTTTSYAFTQTTTLAPINAFSESVRPMYGINKNGNLPPVYNQDLSGPVEYDGTNQHFNSNQNQFVNRPNLPGSTQINDRPVLTNQFQSVIPDQPAYNTQSQRFPSTSQISENANEEVNIPSRFSSEGTTLQPGYNRQTMHGFDRTYNNQRVPDYQVEPNNIQRYNHSQYYNQQKPFSTTFRPEISNSNLRPEYELNKLDQKYKQDFNEPNAFGDQNEGRPIIPQQNYNYKSNGLPETDYQQYYTASTTRPQNFNTSPLPGAGYKKDYDNNETLKPQAGFNIEGNGQRPTVIPGTATYEQDRKSQYPTTQTGSFDENVFRNDVKPGSEVTSAQDLSKNTANSFSATNVNMPGQTILNYPDFSNQRTPGTITRPERPQTDSDRNAVIINYENVQTPDGYSYSYDTSNGIHADESGITINGTRAQGSYSYIGDDGKQYSVTYTADENGFQPHGDHIPTAPPIPKAILEALEKNARDEEAGIFNDGSYDEDKYGHKKYQSAKHPDRQMIQQAAERRNKFQFDPDTGTKFLNNGDMDPYDGYYNEDKNYDFQDSERSSIKNNPKNLTPEHDSKLGSADKSNAEKGTNKYVTNTKNKNQMNLSIQKPFIINDRKNLSIQKSERKNSGQNANGDFNNYNENIGDDYAFLEDNTEPEKDFDQVLDIKKPKEGNTVFSKYKNASLLHRPNAYNNPEAETKRIPTYKGIYKIEAEVGSKDFNAKKNSNGPEQHIQRYKPTNDSSTVNETYDKQKSGPFRPYFKNKTDNDAEEKKTLGSANNEAKLDKKNLRVSNEILSSQMRPKNPLINSKYDRPITTTSYDNMKDKELNTEYNRNQPTPNTKYNRPTSTARYDDYLDNKFSNFKDDERSATPQSQVLQKKRPNAQKTSGFDNNQNYNHYLSENNGMQKIHKFIPTYSKNRTGTLRNEDDGYQYLPPQTKFTQDERVNIASQPFNEHRVTTQVFDGNNQAKSRIKPDVPGQISGQQDQIPRRGQSMFRSEYATNENVDDNDFKQGSTPKLPSNQNHPYFIQDNHDTSRTSGPEPVTGATRDPDYNTYFDSTVSNLNKPSKPTDAVDEPKMQNNYSPQGYNEPGNRKYHQTKTTGIYNLGSSTHSGRIPSTTYRPIYTIGDRSNPTPGELINDLGQPMAYAQDETSDQTIGDINRPIEFTQNRNRPFAPQFSLTEGSNSNQVSNDRLNRPTGSLRPGNQRFGQTASSDFDGDRKKEPIPRFESVDQAEINKPYNGQPTYREDFSGPKQPQRFDPKTGYHY